MCSRCPAGKRRPEAGGSGASGRLPGTDSCPGQDTKRLAALLAKICYLCYNEADIMEKISNQSAQHFVIDNRKESL